MRYKGTERYRRYRGTVRYIGTGGTGELGGSEVVVGRAVRGVEGGVGYRWNLNPAPSKAQTPDMHCRPDQICTEVV